jgi:predicted nucleic acid-binding protein
MRTTEPFFDTNVLVYLASGDTTKAQRAEALLDDGGVVSVQVLNEFAFVVMRKFRTPFREVRETLAAIRATCDVRPLDIETHERGLDIAERYRFSIYDSMIVAAALHAGCAILYTEDLQRGQSIEGLRIRNPF